MTLNCIMQRNPGAGFINTHTHFCTSCEEDATHHINWRDAWCGNVCAPCAKKQSSKMVVEEGIYIEGGSI